VEPDFTLYLRNWCLLIEYLNIFAVFLGYGIIKIRIKLYQTKCVIEIIRANEINELTKSKNNLE
jgi:hypothetical protein